jgi:CRP/FNR family transcriptional regulator
MQMNKRDAGAPLELESCQFCGIGSLCLSEGLVGGNLQSLKPVVQQRFQVKRRENLFRARSRQSSIFVVKSGSLKTCDVDVDGDEQVLDFYLPGDVLGLEDLSTGQHGANAVALEPSWICAVPLSNLGDGAVSDLGMVKEMYSVVCQMLTRQREITRQLGKSEATVRLGAFLLDISNRLSERRLPADQFRLSMDRTDIASYLRTTLETVSRSFSVLQKKGLIQVSAKAVSVTDREGLEQLVNASQS